MRLRFTTVKVARSSNAALSLYSIRIISGVSTVKRALPQVTTALSLAFGLLATCARAAVSAKALRVTNENKRLICRDLKIWIKNVFIKLQLFGDKLLQVEKKNLWNGVACIKMMLI